MAFELTGKLHKVFDTENKTDTFQAREFVIELANGNYTQYIKFQLVQDRCSAIDGYNEGDQVKVDFDLRGREWQGKYFTNLQAWRIEKPQSAPAPAPAAAGDNSSFPSADDEPSGDDAADDLPF